jgi:uncharacterized protein YbdZ (MbtH family)
MSITRITAVYFVLVNDEEQHSLWPAFADVAAGRRVVYGEAEQAKCLAISNRTGIDLVLPSGEHFDGSC